jgi:hypothetical protein
VHLQKDHPGYPRWCPASETTGRLRRAAGLNASACSGHSLRAAFIASALEHRIDTLLNVKQSGHVKMDTLKEYDRRENDCSALRYAVASCLLRMRSSGRR